MTETTQAEKCRIIAEKVMGWKWHRWLPHQMERSIAWYEQSAGVTFLQNPKNIFHSASSEPCEAGSLLRGTPEYKTAVIDKWNADNLYSGIGVSWGAIDVPDYFRDPVAMVDLMSRLRMLVSFNVPRLGHQPDRGDWMAYLPESTECPLFSYGPTPMYAVAEAAYQRAISRSNIN